MKPTFQDRTTSHRSPRSPVEGRFGHSRSLPLKSSVRMIVLCGVFGVMPLGTVVAAGAGGEGAANSHPFPGQPELVSVSKNVIRVGNKLFKDLNANGKLDVYEDWRKPVDARVADLVAQMTLEEKAGLMLIDTAQRLVRPGSGEARCRLPTTSSTRSRCTGSSSATSSPAPSTPEVRGCDRQCHARRGRDVT